MGVDDFGFRTSDPAFPGGGRSRPRVRFSAIGDGWGLFWDRAGTWMLAGLAVVIGNWIVHAVVGSIFGGRIHLGGAGFRLDLPPSGQVLDVVLSTVVNGLFIGGMFRMACRQLRGRPIAVTDLFGVLDVLGDLVLGAALFGLCLFIAGLFCGFPAFIVAGVLMFTFPLIVDGQLNGVEAVRQSWHALKREWLTATVFHLVITILSGVGALCCCVGLFFTLPLYCLSIAVLYHDFFLGKGPAGWEKPLINDPDLA